MSLASEIYAHLISMATWSNQTVLYILWKSIFYGRLSSSFGATKACRRRKKKSYEEEEENRLFDLVRFNAVASLQCYSMSWIVKCKSSADISTLPMTNLCMHKMLYHFIIETRATTNKYWDYFNLNCYHIEVNSLPIRFSVPHLTFISTMDLVFFAPSSTT